MPRSKHFHPDCTVAGDEVVHGARPRPFMVYRNLDLARCSPGPGRRQGRRHHFRRGGGAGGWVLGGWHCQVQQLHGHQLSRGSRRRCPRTRSNEKLQRTRDMLWSDRCAHYVMDEPIELLGVIDDVNSRLARGEHVHDGRTRRDEVGGNMIGQFFSYLRRFEQVSHRSREVSLEILEERRSHRPQRESLAIASPIMVPAVDHETELVKIPSDDC